MFNLKPAKASTDSAAPKIDPSVTAPVANGSKPSGEATPKNKTYIAAGSEVTGNLTINGDILINGSINGNITVSNGSITVMRSGNVKGDMSAPHIMIDGNSHGRCDAEILEIQEHGKLNGIANSTRFSIKNGGIFIGQSEYSEHSAPTAAPSDDRPTRQSASLIPEQAGAMLKTYPRTPQPHTETTSKDQTDRTNQSPA